MKTCKICQHPDVDAIDASLDAAEPSRTIADRHGISRSTLMRHTANCGPKSKAAERKRLVAASIAANSAAAEPSEPGGPTEGPRARGGSRLNRAACAEQAFDWSIAGLTMRAIGEQLGVCKETARRYVRAEEIRRGEELGERREAEKARAVAFYESVAAKAIATADAGKLPGDTARYGDAIKARERIDRILGLDSPTKIDATMQVLVAALNGGDDPTQRILRYEEPPVALTAAEAIEADFTPVVAHNILRGAE